MKLKLTYDNLEDAKTKLAGTFCMYRDKAVTIKVVGTDAVIDPKTGIYSPDYWAYGSYMFNGREFKCKITDPEFNCSNYNIGYMNRFVAGAWFYRVPSKQWKQGLRPDQVRCKFSQRQFADMNFGGAKQLCSMLENQYPSFEEAASLLKKDEANIVAFHRNFAMTLDRIHQDYILEYKGSNIGFTSNLKDFKLMDEKQHLIESLKEAVS